MPGQYFPSREYAEAFDYYRLDSWFTNAIGHPPSPFDGAVYDWFIARVCDLQYSDSED